MATELVAMGALHRGGAVKSCPCAQRGGLSSQSAGKRGPGLHRERSASTIGA